MKTITAILVLGVMLAGCAKSFDVTGEQLSQMHYNSSKSQTECYEWLSDRALADATAMDAMTKDQAFMYLVMKSNNDMVMSLVGKANNPCDSGENVYDMMARVTEAEAERDAEMYGSTLSAVKWVGGIWAGGWALGNVVDKATGDVMSISGEGNSMNRTQTNTNQLQVAGQTTGDNNLGESEAAEVEEPEEEIGDYLGIPGCSSEESYLAGRCAEGPELEAE